MATHSYSELEGLWIQAGGNPAVAPIMAAIAMAESGGADIMQQGGGPGCGIWQITPAQTGCLDAQTNAQQAVAKYNDQGLSAWSTYTGGQWRQYYNPGINPAAQAQAATSAPSTSSAPSCCLWNVGGFCADGLVGWSVAAIGLVAMGAGILFAGRSAL